MLSSARVVGKGQGFKKLWPACLLVTLFVLLGGLYNTCSSCNSDFVWLSLRPASLPSSLIAPEFSPFPKPSSLPESNQQDNSLYRIKEPVSIISSLGLHTGENSTNNEGEAEGADQYSNSTLENGSEELWDQKSPDLGAQVADQPPSATFPNATKDNAPEELGLAKKEENSSHWQGFQRTSNNQHAELHKEHRRSEAHFLEQGLLAAKQAIYFAAATGDGDLYASVYRNLTLFTKSYELMERMFKIYIYKDGMHPLVHTGPTVGIYASEGRFIHQLQSSKQFITTDPSKAHLFFMPYSVTNIVRKLYVPDSHNMHPIISFVTSYVTKIASKYHYWNQSHGADHFFVSCHDWGPATVRENVELRRNAIKVVCNADVNEEFAVAKDVSLPETSLRAAKPPTRLGGPPIKKRPYLAFFAGQMHGRVRPLLLQHWQNTDPDMKIYERIPPTIAKKTSYIRHMRMSKYCICPMGYEVNSPRIVEAIYYDCVPVIIADNLVLPFSEVLDWQSFSVSVKERDIPHLRRILLSIPEAKYTILQTNLKHVRQHFLWHFRTPVKYDVFHMILHSLWLRRLAAIPDRQLFVGGFLPSQTANVTACCLKDRNSIMPIMLCAILAGRMISITIGWLSKRPPYPVNGGMDVRGGAKRNR
ncbi:hypothetical protein GOP47_0003164 [Adiantum capillus-veneris]|uniref:Exostosin GT47 domain-containing protein n=1 Tax=Adiantum capillus-veneris TaxID=13818 RepID=A0A9D4VD03_ADICA|nr:hypothetical protein GOP47_0003164 [Adiantum capillus-veneris]